MSSVSSASTSDVLFVRHFPRCFGEDEMKKFFSQFGRILNVRVVRSRKTGRPKTVAYVRFQVPDVAQIAADAMDNYLMFGKLMRCGLVSTSNVHLKKLFPWKRPQTTIERHRANMNKDKSEKGEKKSRLKKQAMVRKCKDVLSQYGLQFEPVVISKLAVQKEAVGVPVKKEAKAKEVKPRPLIKAKIEEVASVTTQKPPAVKLGKKSGLRVRTITASKSVSSATRKTRSQF